MAVVRVYMKNVDAVYVPPVPVLRYEECWHGRIEVPGAGNTGQTTHEAERHFYEHITLDMSSWARIQVCVYPTSTPTDT